MEKAFSAEAIAEPSWARVSTLSEFNGQQQLTCRVAGWDLLLIRTGGEVIVLHNYCTHLGKPLAGGRVMGGQISCPFHGACFDVKTGAALSGPAVFPLHRFPSRIEADEILADLSKRPLNLGAGFGAGVLR